MLTKAKQAKALEKLNDAQFILKSEEDADIDILCSLGDVISNVYNMETEG